MSDGDAISQGIGFASGTGTVPDVAAATRLPFIATSGVLTPSQIQQQVNAAYARNDAKVTSAIQRLQGDMAGRGFSANSPIFLALSVGLTGQGLRASLQTASQIRIDAAKVNADAVFAGQKAVSDQFIQQEGVVNDDNRNSTTRAVGVLTAVMNMVGSAL